MRLVFCLVVAMQNLKELLRQYWPNLLAVCVLGLAVARYVNLGQWEHNIAPMAFAALGALSVVASDEVVEALGQYGWTRDQWRVLPSVIIRILGACILAVATIVLYAS